MNREISRSILLRFLVVFAVFAAVGRSGTADVLTAFAIVHLKISYTEIFAGDRNHIITFWAAKPTYEKLEREFEAFRDSFRVLD